MGPSLQGQPVLSHDGSALGFRAMQWLLPEEDTGFVVLANGNDQADEYQLVRVAYNVQRLLFGAPLVERTAEVDPLLRWGKQGLVLLVVVQLALGALAWRALRRRRAGVGRTRSGGVVLALAAVVDVVALGLVLGLLPRLLDTPLRLVLEAPDVRLLVALVVLGALSGVARAVVWGVGGRAPVAAGRAGFASGPAGLVHPARDVGVAVVGRAREAERREVEVRDAAVVVAHHAQGLAGVVAVEALPGVGADPSKA